MRTKCYTEPPTKRWRPNPNSKSLVILMFSSTSGKVGMGKCTGENKTEGVLTLALTDFVVPVSGRSLPSRRR